MTSWIKEKINKFLSWLFPYQGQPHHHISEDDASYYRFKRNLNNIVGYAKKPDHELDQGTGRMYR